MKEQDEQDRRWSRWKGTWLMAEEQSALPWQGKDHSMSTKKKRLDRGGLSRGVDSTLVASERGGKQEVRNSVEVKRHETRSATTTRSN